MDSNFKNEAIDLVGRVVKARCYCAKHHEGRLVQEETIKPVRDQYKMYASKWNERGIAVFLLQYQNNIFNMTTAAVQVNKLITLIQQANQIVNNNQFCSKQYTVCK